MITRVAWLRGILPSRQSKFRVKSLACTMRAGKRLLSDALWHFVCVSRVERESNIYFQMIVVAWSSFAKVGDKS